ncbi:hypothetical protein QBC33DRAFT_548801 [Phialemonium atrogriseum]|uniref:FAD/NAD(P)-binding domain-containing protein n=1 Tax=Phialemonium atrogriseum TaxID=1093897 RepID=A0AAJ0BSV7_9PEZI|nr:uncharacterized protein QBC33DRAFT_548801 [Phialemonium atrogriseum]KAK1763883.1 hypothetical protein QBC33DRAFT_548801 [Phialemonium atrogriseum]
MVRLYKTLEYFVVINTFISPRPRQSLEGSETNMINALRNVVVVGGSYVGVNAAKELANLLPSTHRVLLIEPHSHFHHLFAFPRFAILPDHEHKAFIPYKGVFSAAPDASRHAVVKARVVSLQATQLTLDREWEGSRLVSFEYLVAASGTRLPAPGSMQSNEKPPSVDYFKVHQEGVKKAPSILIIGGGAVGVQMACDLKEVYPDKEITLVHSRDVLMPVYHEKLSNIIKDRFKELGVNLVTGSRVIVPPAGFPTDGRAFEVELKDGQKLSTNLAILATGQTPNNGFLSSLRSSSKDSLINPANGFIRVLPTFQFQDPLYPNMFAIGDIADSGAHKAAKPGMGQASAAARNIVAMIEGKAPSETVAVAPPAIHLTLGLTKNIIFRNPNLKEGATEPFTNLKDDGQADMGIEGVWAKRGVTVASPQEYHL